MSLPYVFTLRVHSSLPLANSLAVNSTPVSHTCPPVSCHQWFYEPLVAVPINRNSILSWWQAHDEILQFHIPYSPWFLTATEGVVLYWGWSPRWPQLPCVDLYGIEPLESSTNLISRPLRIPSIHGWSLCITGMPTLGRTKHSLISLLCPFLILSQKSYHPTL